MLLLKLIYTEGVGQSANCGTLPDLVVVLCLFLVRYFMLTSWRLLISSFKMVLTTASWYVLERFFSVVSEFLYQMVGDLVRFFFSCSGECFDDVGEKV